MFHMIFISFESCLFLGGAEEDLPHWGRPRVLRDEDVLAFEEPLFDLKTGRSLYNPLLVDDNSKRVPFYPDPRASIYSRVKILP